VSKQSRRNRMKIDPHQFEAPLDMLEDEFDLDFEFENPSGEPQRPDWWSELESDERISARRKIERRREREALSSELDDWAGLGKHDWH
jgi:hypothetical protein